MRDDMTEDQSKKEAKALREFHKKLEPYKEPKYYDVQDVINAEYTLEPLKCRHCKKIGDVIYQQYIGDAVCENCGEWQLDWTKQGKRKKMHS